MIFNKKRLEIRRNGTPPQKREKPKSCERVVKRDGQGRIIKERFVGCTKEEIKAMREIEGSEDKD